MVAASLAVLGASPAFAQFTEKSVKKCQDKVEAVTSDAKDFLERGANQPGAAVLRELRSAAKQLEAQKLQDSCLMVVKAMQVALTAYETAPPLASPQQPATAGAAKTKTRPPATATELKGRAIRFGDTTMNTAQLEGVNVFNYNNLKIGNVEGVLAVDGKPSHLIVSTGGFFSLGGHEVAIPMEDVRWDPVWKAFLVPYSEETVKDAPEYNAKNGKWSVDTNDRYYATLTY